MRLWMTFGALALTLMILSAWPAHSEPAQDLRELTTTMPVEMVGVGEISSKGSTVALDPSGFWSGSLLTAETAIIRMAWEEGLKAGPAVDLVTMQGTETIKLSDVEFKFTELTQSPGEPVFVALGEETDAAVTVSTLTGWTLEADRDVQVVAIGSSPEGTGVGEYGTGFWHTIEGPAIRGESSGIVQMEGDFDLFLHNMRIEATSEEKQWSDWTGYREENPEILATEYVFRVTKIKVQNGTFIGSSKSPLTLISGHLESSMDGAIASSGVSGQIILEDRVHLFDHDPLRLKGQGTVSVEAVGEGADSSTLKIRPSDGFEIQGASGTEMLYGPATSSVAAMTLASGAGALLVMGVYGALAATGLAAFPSKGSRRLRHSRALEHGWHAAEAGKWEKATRHFKQAVRSDDTDPLAWYGLASTELRAGRPDHANKIACMGQQIPGMDPLDIQELRAKISWARGDKEIFEELLVELLDSSPEMGRELLQELGVDPSNLTVAVQKKMISPHPDSDLPGYI